MLDVEGAIFLATAILMIWSASVIAEDFRGPNKFLLLARFDELERTDYPRREDEPLVRGERVTSVRP